MESDFSDHPLHVVPGAGVVRPSWTNRRTPAHTAQEAGTDIKGGGEPEDLPDGSSDSSIDNFSHPISQPRSAGRRQEAWPGRSSSPAVCRPLCPEASQLATCHRAQPRRPAPPQIQSCRRPVVTARAGVRAEEFYLTTH